MADIIPFLWYNSHHGMDDALKLFASSFTPPGWKSGGGGAVCIPSLTGAADAFLALTLAENRVVLAVTPGIPAADRLVDDLRVIAPENVRVLEFPPSLGGDKSALGLRLKTVAALRAWDLSPYPCVVVAPFPALLSPLPSETATGIRLGTAPVAFGTVCGRLAEIGYNRVPQVEQEGDFSVRGGIVDAWSPGDEFPIRAEFFGDDLESLRTFSPATQVSIARIAGAELMPIEVSATGDKPPPSTGDRPRRTIADLLPGDPALLAIEHNEYDLSGVLRPEGFRMACYTGDPAPRRVATYGFQTAPLPGFAELGADEAHHPELFDAARKRLEQHLAAAHSVAIDRIAEARVNRPRLCSHA